jgi:murein L,D-transpeptidase YafK
MYNRTGKNIMVHGGCFSSGCYAVGNEGVEEIYLLSEAALQKGQDSFNVHIFPFRMTADNLEKHKNSEWKSFWDNLKTGYDSFEKDKIPPNVIVKNKQYIFSNRL